MTVEEIIKIYHAAGDAAYDDYLTMCSRPVRKEEEPDIDGKFRAEALRLRCSAREAIGEALGKHRACVAFVHALRGIQQTSMPTEELIAPRDEISLSQV